MAAAAISSGLAFLGTASRLAMSKGVKPSIAGGGSTSRARLSARPLTMIILIVAPLRIRNSKSAGSGGR
jgi:hypothetical protein